jgi:hypothetical protein
MIDISIFINGVDKTSVIQTAGFQKSDATNNVPDILRFKIETHTGQTYVPDANDEVEVFDDATKIFGGVIVQIDNDVDLGLTTVTHDITCRDYGQDLSRQLMVERFENTNVDDIIEAILLKYAPEFDNLYVDAPIDVTSITFNNITVSQALDKLSKLTNYQWYVDYDKHVHFFETNAEVAPFDIVDGDGNYIPDTFSIKTDLTQIKNRITVRGGEVEVNEVTFTIKGAIGKLQDNDDRTFDLSYKFSKKPQVSVNATPVLVGVVGFDSESEFDVMWSYEQKYLNFINTNITIIDADDIEITGIPLETIQVRVQDSGSIFSYGRWDAVFTVPGIKTREEALQYAEAQKEASKNPIYSGSFSTYESGLRSGQIININSTDFGINEDFFINRVTFRMLTPTKGIWTAEISTVRQITLIDILNRIVGNPESDKISLEGLLSYIEFEDTADMVEGVPVFSQTSGPYQIWPDVGSGTGSPLLINFSTIAA